MRNEKSGLSHFSRLPIRWNGVDWPTSEHACRAAMFMWSSPKTVYRILNARTPLDALYISEENQHLQRPLWESKEVGIPIVMDICGSKLFQYPSTIKELLDTKDTKIVLDVNNEFWGTGNIRADGTWPGKNEAGNILMRFRDILISR